MASDFYAHSPADKTRQPPDGWQPLAEHLQLVGCLARQFARTARPILPDDSEQERREKELFHVAGFGAGLLHDLGKYRDEFQAYLRAGDRAKSTAETAHSVYGAAAACYCFNSQAIAFAVAAHHAGLHDCSALQSLIGGKKFQAEQRFPGLLERARSAEELGSFPSLEPIAFDDTDQDRRRYEFLTRMLFSMLVDADRLNTEKWHREHILGRSWDRPTIEFHADCLLQRLQAAREEKAASRPADELNRLRNDVFESCVKRAQESLRGFFTLTVPTGGGKTLSSMGFALAHAKRHNLRRVIVVIPYLSIIEQNAREYREIFGAGQVLEHHSAVESPEAARPSPDDINDEPRQASDAERAMENWDAPIIVTTSVQFIETLFAASTSRARKLHNIAQSVVIFDEVQTLPTHLLEPTLDVFRTLTDHYGVSFLFCSATQPAFRKSASLKSGFEPAELIEIAPDPIGMYRSLQRVNYRIESKDDQWDWGRLADRMLSQPRSQTLCILNLRRQAFEAWQALRQRLQEQSRENDLNDGLFHLSSAMCPAHRLDLLGLSKAPPANNIKARLKEGKPCWVASTQLIECGVDADFPVVFRAMGPLDSIVQAAGRCNREGTLKDASGKPRLGDVIVFHPMDGGLPPGVYDKATAITPGYLDPQRLASDPSVFGQYFSELFQIAPTDHAKKGEHTIQHLRREFKFRTVAERAKVIKEDTISIITPYGDAKKLVKAIQKSQRFDRDTLRRLQRYMVSLRRGPYSDFAKLQELGALQPLLPRWLEIPVLAHWCYDQYRGVVIENRSPEDFIL